MHVTLSQAMTYLCVLTHWRVTLHHTTTTIGLREPVEIAIAKQYRSYGLQHTLPAIITWALKPATASMTKTLDPWLLTGNMDYMGNHDAADTIGLHI